MSTILRLELDRDIARPLNRQNPAASLFPPLLHQ
jgi:hypothetical protein